MASNDTAKYDCTLRLHRRRDEPLNFAASGCVGCTGGASFCVPHSTTICRRRPIPSQRLDSASFTTCDRQYKPPCSATRCSLYAAAEQHCERTRRPNGDERRHVKCCLQGYTSSIGNADNQWRTTVTGTAYLHIARERHRATINGGSNVTGLTTAPSDLVTFVSSAV